MYASAYISHLCLVSADGGHGGWHYGQAGNVDKEVAPLQKAKGCQSNLLTVIALQSYHRSNIIIQRNIEFIIIVKVPLKRYMIQEQSSHWNVSKQV